MKDCGDAIGVEVDTPPFLSDVPRYKLFRIFFQKGIMPSMLKHVSASILALSLLCPAMASAQAQKAVPQNRAAMQLSFAPRSEARRVGKGDVSLRRSRWSPVH